MTVPLNVLLFGGCLLRRPIRSVPDLAAKLDSRKYGNLGVVHSFSEMVQIVEVLRGQKDVPQELKRLIGVSADLKPLPEAAQFRDIDLALIEPGSPVDISFRGLAINRGHIESEVLRPIERHNEKAAKPCRKWMRVGIVELNETVRAETAAELIELVPDDDEAELRRAVIRETRAVKSDMDSGFKKMQTLLGCPLGAVVYIFRYMPDGRPVSWPAGSREEVIRVAAQLDLPIFEPTAMVQSYGVSAALGQDSRHYSEAFLPVIGGALVEFAQSIHAQSKASAHV